MRRGPIRSTRSQGEVPKSITTVRVDGATLPHGPGSTTTTADGVASWTSAGDIVLIHLPGVPFSAPRASGVYLSCADLHRARRARPVHQYDGQGPAVAADVRLSLEGFLLDFDAVVAAARVSRWFTGVLPLGDSRDRRARATPNAFADSSCSAARSAGGTRCADRARRCSA
jgi:hypothetical protein